MSYIDRNLRQTATYWAPGSADGYGFTAFSAPTSIKVRWEDHVELFLDTDGRETKSQARVYVKSDVVVGGYLYLGTSTETDPATVDGSREVRDFRKMPDLYNTKFERRVFL